MMTVSDLSVVSAEGTRLLDGVSLTLERGDCICLTGASGSGKSTLIRTVMGIGGSGLIVASGDIQLDGKSVLSLSKKDRRELCGTVFGFIPQNSMTAFFPNVKVGKQIMETYRTRLYLSKDAALGLARETLTQVNLKDTERVLNAYPGQLSGGMLQRVAMSMVLGMKPAYIFADEPTSALDKSNRTHLIRLLSAYRDGGILFVSHDVGAIRALCPRTCVMEHGRIIEERGTEELFANPREDWTRRFVHAAERNTEESERWKQLR